MSKLPESYPSLVIEGTPEELEAILPTLADAGTLGTEEVSTRRWRRQKVYFPPGTDVGPLCGELARHFPFLHIGDVETVPAQDWLRSWKKDLAGFAVGEGFYIVPSWEAVPETERIVLRIDPERAFGTGSHDTTRLCLELVELLARPGTKTIDAGTGTGVLAMAAASLGSQPVYAIEADPGAASCARDNVIRNGLEGRVEIENTSMADASPPPAHLVTANVHDTVLRKNLARLSSWVLPGGSLILSGLLLDQIQPLVQSLPRSFYLRQHRTAGEWGALWIGRETPRPVSTSGAADCAAG
ncbi:MAG: 50S ribosomal protein L11 methyltransferase [Acidobacteriota bacterium]